ncbi:MAG: hypothetical protein WBN42_11050 [Ignavibacteriaceae bacterium]
MDDEMVYDFGGCSNRPGTGRGYETPSQIKSIDIDQFEQLTKTELATLEDPAVARLAKVWLDQMDDETRAKVSSWIVAEAKRQHILSTIRKAKS